MNAVYVSYDGVLDPLGASQITPYVVGLAKSGIAHTLISFEKPRRLLETSRVGAIRDRLRQADVSWVPLGYHKHPRLLATAYDLLQGIHVIRRECHRGQASIIHCRGDVAMAMARAARLRSVSLLYDVRGLFSDERVESGSWARGSWLDRTVRSIEAGNLSHADGIVALTRPGIDELRLRRPCLPAHRIIPTCVDVDRFHPPKTDGKVEYGVVYVGSLGTWYMAEEMIAFAREAAAFVPGRTLFLTPQTDEAIRMGADASWADVRFASPDEVPAWLRRCRAAMFFIRPTPAKRASCPTKLGECLATGLPFVTNTGIGDLDELVRREPIGAIVTAFGTTAYRAAAAQLAALVHNPDTAKHCRRVAETEFSLHTAVSRYGELYKEIVEDRKCR